MRMRGTRVKCNWTTRRTRVCAFVNLANLDSFYVTFWSLQTYLKNPLMLHSQDALNEFKPKLDFVLHKFFQIEQERLKLRGQISHNKTLSQDQKMDIVPTQEKSDYYPGFLKSRQLFDLQLADSKFRRTVLFQIMVLMRHLLSLTLPEKEKRDKRLQTPNKVVLYPFTLSPEDGKWAQQKDKDAYNLTDLAFQPHLQHRTFTKAIRAVLDRDEFWVRWKENGCPPFEEKSLTEADYAAMEARLRKILAPLPEYPYPVGNAPLSEIWKEDLSMESLKGRVHLPSPEDYVTEELDKVKLEELPPAEQVEKIDERASKEWRGLRLAMRSDMVGVADAKGSLSKYVEMQRSPGKNEMGEMGSTAKQPVKERSAKVEESKGEGDEKGEPMDTRNGS
jgi:THO complex subunit 1